MATKFSVSTVFKAVDQVSAPLARMTSNITRFASRAESSLGRVNKGLNQATAGIKAGVQATAAAGLAASGTLAKMTTVGADFEQQLTNAVAKFPGEIKRGTEAFERLESTARQVGATTEFSASQAAGALDFLAMAGFNANQSIAALPGVVDLATAANLDLARATDIASDTLGAFGLMTKDTTQLTLNLARVNDVMAKTATSANVTLESLFESFKEAGPVATAAGQSIETMAAAAGTLANSGIKGAQAGTVLRNMMIRLQAPTGQAVSVLQRLGLRVSDSEGNMRDMFDIIGDLNKATAGMADVQKANVMQVLFGAEAIAGANVLLSAGQKELNGYRQQLLQAEGASARMAATMRDTTQNDIKGMMSAIEGVTISLFELNRDGIRETIGGVTEWVRNINQLLNSNTELGESIARTVLDAVINMVKAIGVLIGVMVALKVATLATNVAIVAFRAAAIAANAATWLWQAAIAALPVVLKAARVAMLAFNIALRANPIGLVVTAVAALGAAAVALLSDWGPVGDFFADMWDGLKTTFDVGVKVVSKAAKPFIDLLGNIRELTGSVGGFFGFGSDEAPDAAATGPLAAPGAIVASPQESIVRSINQNNSNAEITLRNETGNTAEVTQRSGPMNLNIMSSGAF